ncbi:MAG: hypothetical protein A3J47_00970 [Candidatus Yanofskybacteria bacterium RIFCSPHIGHO2_02_FULL_43_22]|uniref:Uncharacterized protein n=1 Tax=Candidatus Yanofskybacteria bacterium RIFCSPHIGHO2_02_FULL_43_22 TaxID=1802681 RepID=A0A1F8FNG2_9BACT|nr:MAG: hypothetical protein A3J47_00970 [Candidatus Yanofskybacteria bacterium RIFCSPHIGHO2_02_FULL_43_22]
MANREARVSGPSDSENSSPNQWAAVSAAHQMTDNFSESHISVYIYNQVRTQTIINTRSSKMR